MHPPTGGDPTQETGIKALAPWGTGPALVGHWGAPGNAALAPTTCAMLAAGEFWVVGMRADTVEAMIILAFSDLGPLACNVLGKISWWVTMDKLSSN